MNPRFPAVLLLVSALFGGCSTAYKESIGGDTTQVFSRIYLADFNTSWQAVLESLKSLRLDVTNREGGFIQTRWTENTAEKNFTDSFGGADAYLKAKYRFKVTVARGFYNGRPSIKVSVQKDQLVEHDVLEGWRGVETDSIEEKTLLYRIGRIIVIKTRIAKLEEIRSQEQLDKTMPKTKAE